MRNLIAGLILASAVCGFCLETSAQATVLPKPLPSPLTSTDFSGLNTPNLQLVRINQCQEFCNSAFERCQGRAEGLSGRAAARARTYCLAHLITCIVDMCDARREGRYGRI